MVLFHHVAYTRGRKTLNTIACCGPSERSYGICTIVSLQTLGGQLWAQVVSRSKQERHILPHQHISGESRDILGRSDSQAARSQADDTSVRNGFLNLALGCQRADEVSDEASLSML